LANSPNNLKSKLDCQ